MKKLFIAMILIVLLSACEMNINSKTNIIKPVEFTKRESTIVTSTTEQAFMFEFKTGTKYKKATVWIEKYEFGKFVAKVNEISTEVDKGKGNILFTVSKLNEQSNESIFTITIADESGSGSGWGPEKILNEVSTMATLNENEEIPLSGENVLAGLVYSKQSSVSSFSVDFYKDPEKHVDEIAVHDVVYLLKINFTK